MPEGLSRPSREAQEARSTVDAASDIVSLDRTVVSNPTSSQEATASRLQQNDSRREYELSELNAVRARLSLPPSETSVALTALAKERERLLGERTGTEVVAHHAQDDRTSIDSQRPRLGELLPEFKEGLRVTGPTRRYFEELGPDETVRRFEKGGPEFVDKIRALIENGNVHDLIWRMEGIGPEFPNSSNTPGMESIAGQDAAYSRFGDKVMDKIERLKREVVDER